MESPLLNINCKTNDFLKHKIIYFIQEHGLGVSFLLTNANKWLSHLLFYWLFWMGQLIQLVELMFFIIFSCKCLLMIRVTKTILNYFFRYYWSVLFLFIFNFYSIYYFWLNIFKLYIIFSTRQIWNSYLSNMIVH